MKIKPHNMKALYTKIFDQFLKEYDNSPLWEEVKTSFSLFPMFQITDNTGTVVHSFNMYDLFVSKYKMREIGAEDDQLFYEYIKKRVDLALIEYVPKIQTYLENMGKLMERTYKSGEDYTVQTYLYPLGSNAAQLATQQKNIGGRTYAFYSGASNPGILKEVIELKNIYLSAVESFDVCFMGVY